MRSSDSFLGCILVACIAGEEDILQVGLELWLLLAVIPGETVQLRVSFPSKRSWLLVPGAFYTIP